MFGIAVYILSCFCMLLCPVAQGKVSAKIQQLLNTLKVPTSFTKYIITIAIEDLINTYTIHAFKGA